MIIQKAVKDETKKISLGVLLLSAVMLLIFLLLGKLNYKVVLGTALGAAAAIGNFFWMAISVQKAAEKMNGAEVDPEEPEGETEDTKKSVSPEAKNAKKGMQLSYTLRMLLIVLVALIAIKVPVFDALPALIALFFPRIVIFFLGFMMRKEKKAS